MYSHLTVEIMPPIFKVEELKTLPWSEEKKADYIATYSQKEIVCLSTGVSNDVLKSKHLDFMSAKGVK